jgi:hypothetical protein
LVGSVQKIDTLIGRQFQVTAWSIAGQFQFMFSSWFFDQERRLRENVFKTEEVGISGQSFHPHIDSRGTVSLGMPIGWNEPQDHSWLR